jgi:hypothetical protein
VEELAVGDEEEDEVPVFPVVPESAVVPDETLPLFDVEADPDDEELAPDVAVVPAARAPGRSCATTIPMATVAPVAARTAPRVTVRSRDLALSLSAGVLGWPGADMWLKSFVGNAPIPTCSNRH